MLLFGSPLRLETQAAAARTFHTGQRQSLGELLAQNQHLAQMAGSPGECAWRVGEEAAEASQMRTRTMKKVRVSRIWGISRSELIVFPFTLEVGLVACYWETLHA